MFEAREQYNSEINSRLGNLEEDAIANKLWLADFHLMHYLPMSIYQVQYTVNQFY